MINKRKFRLLYLTPFLTATAMWFWMGFKVNNTGFLTGDNNMDLLFLYTITCLVLVTLCTLIPLGLFQNVIDIKKDKDFWNLLAIQFILVLLYAVTFKNISDAKNPLLVTLFFVVMCLIALKTKAKKNVKYIFPILTVIVLILYVPGGLINKSGIEGFSNLLLAYAIGAILPLIFSIPLLKNK